MATASGEFVNVDLRWLFEQFEYFAQPHSFGTAPLGKYGICLVGMYSEGRTDGTIGHCDHVKGKVYWDEY